MTDQTTLPSIIRALGRGKSGRRHLTFEEAQFAMTSILEGSISGPQLGAFLMLLRVKEEVPEEIAGMVMAAESWLGYVPIQTIDVCWPAYAGKKRQPSWYLLSAKLLAAMGYKILIHGAGEHTPGRQYARQTCQELGIPVEKSLSEAEEQIKSVGISYLHLADFIPTLSDLIDMKAELGLRSPVNTLVRHLNPLKARLTLQGMFHPAYMPLHHQSALLLGQANNLVVKGDAGEFEVRPDSETRCAQWRNNEEHSGNLVPTLKARAVRPEKPSLTDLQDLWKNKAHNPYGEEAALETAALIVSNLEDISHQEARSRCDQAWVQRIS